MHRAATYTWLRASRRAVTTTASAPITRKWLTTGYAPAAAADDIVATRDAVGSSAAEPATSPVAGRTASRCPKAFITSRSPNASEPGTAYFSESVSVFQPLEPTLAGLNARVKENYDPHNILNPGRMG